MYWKIALHHLKATKITALSQGSEWEMYQVCGRPEKAADIGLALPLVSKYRSALGHQRWKSQRKPLRKFHNF